MSPGPLRKSFDEDEEEEEVGSSLNCPPLHPPPLFLLQHNIEFFSPFYRKKVVLLSSLLC